jgi:guanylate kinase
MKGAPCGRVVVVSGPSGVGKTTLVDRLFAICPLPLVRSVSATTRPPRGEEVDGVDYYFVSPERFQALRAEGQFVECCEVFGQGCWYGTLWSEVRGGIEAGKWVVLNIDVHGAAAVLEQFDEAITIFVQPGSMEVLRGRLAFRGTDSPEEIAKRLERAQYEMQQARLSNLYRHQVINDDLERAVTEICTILTEEKESERND